MTLHKIDEGIDTGPIVSQRTFPLQPYLTARQLYEIYTDEAFLLFKDSFPSLIERSHDLTPQDDSQASYYSRKSLDLQSLEIDLCKVPDMCAGLFVR